MPRAGLSPAIVVAEAAVLADEVGYDELSLTALAGRLGVAVPSLYKHVDGLDALRRDVALLAIGELGAAMRAALARASLAQVPAGQRSDLRALAEAYRGYALEHPGRYAATVRAAPPEDSQLRAASDDVLRTTLAVLGSLGLEGDAAVHAARSLRASLHGFVSLETAGGFGLPQDIERSFSWMVGALELGVAARAGAP